MFTCRNLLNQDVKGNMDEDTKKELINVGVKEKTEGRKELIQDELIFLLLEFELSIRMNKFSRAEELMHILMAKEDCLGLLVGPFSRLLLEGGRRVKEASPWLRAVLSLPPKGVSSDVRDASIRLLLATSDHDQEREGLVMLLSCPEERELAWLQVTGTLAPPAGSQSCQHLLQLLAKTRFNPGLRKEVATRVFSACDKEEGLVRKEKEELLACVVLCAREESAEAYHAVCEYARLVGPEQGDCPGLGLVLEVGSSLVQGCLQHEGVEAEQWLGLLTFLSSCQPQHRHYFLHLAELLVLLLLRSGRPMDAAARLKLWVGRGLAAKLGLAVSLAAGHYTEALGSLASVEGEEGVEGTLALLARLLREQVVDSGTLRQLLLGLQEQDFYGSVALVR